MLRRTSFQKRRLDEGTFSNDRPVKSGPAPRIDHKISMPIQPPVGFTPLIRLSTLSPRNRPTNMVKTPPSRASGTPISSQAQCGFVGTTSFRKSGSAGFIASQHLRRLGQRQEEAD